MKPKLLLGLSLAGLAFAGYLSAVKLFSDTCAFGEGCPLFIGYPACYFGFGMYALLALFALAHVLGKLAKSPATAGLLFVSGLGILFAGYFTVLELPKLFSEGLRAYMLGLPTCALGLIFYIAIFIIALGYRKTPDTSL